MMKTYILPALRILLVFTIITGVVYPVAMTILALAVFPYQAKGSMIVKNGTTIGSVLIGQRFTGDQYFNSRPSAISDNPQPSSATNWGPTDKRMADSVKVRRTRFIEQNNLPAGTDVPKEMLFASSSGVDPDISPEAAHLQVDRIARLRGIKRRSVETLVEQYTESPQFGIFGEPRVNVLKLNLALDGLKEK